MGLALVINGRVEELEGLAPGASLADAIAALQLKGDRIAVECNGEIRPRERWSQTTVYPDDRLEIVHFVGGGSGLAWPAGRSSGVQPAIAPADAADFLGSRI